MIKDSVVHQDWRGRENAFTNQDEWEVGEREHREGRKCLRRARKGI